MELLVQMCVVIATLALVVLTVATLVVLKRLAALGDSMSGLARNMEGLLEQTKSSWTRIDAVLCELEQVSRAVRGGTARLGGLMGRTTDLAGDVLDEVQRPVRQAVAVVRGVRAAAYAMTHRQNGASRMAGVADVLKQVVRDA